MEEEAFIRTLRDLLSKHEVVSALEWTMGNYDETGHLITEAIPTVTTTLCEIGMQRNEIYFVYIVPSESFSKDTFDALRTKTNVNIYGFIDFNTTLYSNDKTVPYEELKETCMKDTYVQIQFTYPWQENSPQKIYESYLMIEELFSLTKTTIVNQLDVKLR